MALIILCYGAATFLLALGPVGGAEPHPAHEASCEPLPTGALARLGTTRFRTGGRVFCLAYSPNGKLLAAGCGDDPVHVWDAETGRELFQIKDPWVYGLAFSPDGALLATAGSFQTVRLWKTATGEPFGQPLMGHQSVIKTLAFSPDGSLLASAGQDKTIRLWAMPDRNPLTTLAGHQDEINALAFAPDGKTLASGGADSTIRLWETPSGRPLHQVDSGCAVAALAFTRDCKLISGGDDNRIQLWDIGMARAMRKLQGHDRPVNALLPTPDGKALISGDQGRSLRLWNLDTGQELRQMPRQPGDADALALSPDGRTLAAGGTNNAIRRWDLSGKELPSGSGHRAGIASLVLAPDGKWLASGSTAGNIRFWMPDTHQEMPALDLAGEDAVLAGAPDGKTLAVVDGNTPSVRLVDVSTRQVRARFSGPKDDPVFCGAFSPDGKLLAVGHERSGVQLWNVAAGTVARSLPHPGAVQALAFAPDGSVVVSGGAEGMMIWNPATGTGIIPAGKGSPVASLAFAPDGLTLAVGRFDATIALYDMRPGETQGKDLRSLEGHQSSVFSVAFSPDGRLLASAGHDRTVRLWEIASGQQISVWTGHRGPVSAVTFLPAGRALISGSADTSLLLWDVTGQSKDGHLALERIGSGDLEGLWLTLASNEPPRAYRALWTLIAGARDAVPLLEKQKRVALVDPQHIEQLLRDLNNDRYSARERAYGELAKYGRWVEGVLDTALKKPASEEVRRRVEKLLSMIRQDSSLTLAQERLRAHRLMMVLEQCGTPAARELLEKLSRMAAEADLRADAKASLARLQKRRAG
jgi:WD40 repeat protein